MIFSMSANITSNNGSRVHVILNNLGVKKSLDEIGACWNIHKIYKSIALSLITVNNHHEYYFISYRLFVKNATRIAMISVYQMNLNIFFSTEPSISQLLKNHFQLFNILTKIGLWDIERLFINQSEGAMQ